MQPDQPKTERPAAVDLHPLVIPLATPQKVPRNIATCPECGGTLYWQATTTDCLEDLFVECENEPDDDDQIRDQQYHRWWQSDWQPMLDNIKRWLRKQPNAIKLSHDAIKK